MSPIICKIFVADRVELQGGDGASSGNVFARNSDGYLGPVCDSGWDEAAAAVVCRQLGFTGATPTTGSSFGPVPTKSSMASVNCTGSEAHLQDCFYIPSSYCSAVQGAGVMCESGDSTPGPTDPATTATDPAEGCPAGWVDGGHLGCFIFLPDQAGLSWLEGLEVCEAAGGWLAEPRSQEQLLFLSSLAYLEEELTGVRGWWVLHCTVAALATIHIGPDSCS